MEDNIDKREAELLARLEAEREQRLAEKIAAGEIVSVPLFIVAGSEASARAQVEQAKADKLAELHAAGDRREVKFDVNVVITGVVQHGEARDPASVPSAPGFASGEDAPKQHLPPPVIAAPTPPGEVVEEEAREERPLIETYVCVQIGQCRDDADPGQIFEGWYSIDGKVLTVTDASGGYVGSRTLLEGENARVVAKRLLREKTPESESFSRPLSYPNAGLA
jgi:hypothetical protein